MQLTNPAGTAGMPHGCCAVVQIKDAAGNYSDMDGGILSERKPTLQVQGPCTFRVQKKVGVNSFGVDLT